MGYCENKQNKVPYGYYHCVKNGQGLSQCSMHYVRYDVLYNFVLSRLRYWINAVHQDEQAIIERLSKSNVNGTGHRQQAGRTGKETGRKAAE